MVQMAESELEESEPEESEPEESEPEESEPMALFFMAESELGALLFMILTNDLCRPVRRHGKPFAAFARSQRRSSTASFLL